MSVPVDAGDTEIGDWLDGLLPDDPDVRDDWAAREDADGVGDVLGDGGDRVRDDWAAREDADDPVDGDGASDGRVRDDWAAREDADGSDAMSLLAPPSDSTAPGRSSSACQATSPPSQPVIPASTGARDRDRRFGYRTRRPVDAGTT
ncbi:MAG: type II toxin-antitoxin system HipA family toxin [Acidimicrobiaceae bacterium]|nr:type II toxin-antitoxin system HipA family toxin [Acidimicrobiaceae bacterium]MYI52727.1 type II toxin-antitoxin system HipA family toxin [Acidimicrobiaceae bacterium]